MIIGGGGHGREVLDVVEALNATGRGAWNVLGFLDDGHPDLDLLERRGARHLGPTDRLADLAAPYVIAIGDGGVRRRIDERFRRAGLESPTLVHPSATLGREVRLGPGTVVAAGARLTTNVTVGRHVHVNVNATVSHDVVLGDYVTVSPGVNVSGAVVVGDEVLLGTGAVLNQGLRIGSRTTVGSGAVVTRSLPADVTAVGVPARPVTYRDRR